MPEQRKALFFKTFFQLAVVTPFFFGGVALGRVMTVDENVSLDATTLQAVTSSPDGGQSTSSEQLFGARLSWIPRWEQSGQLFSLGLSDEHTYGVQSRGVQRTSAIDGISEQEFSRGYLRARGRVAEQELRGSLTLTDPTLVLEAQPAESRVLVERGDIYGGVFLSPIDVWILSSGGGVASGEYRSEDWYAKTGLERELPTGSIQLLAVVDRTRVYNRIIDDAAFGGDRGGRFSVTTDRLGMEGSWLRRVTPNATLIAFAEGGDRRVGIEYFGADSSRYGGGGLTLRHEGGHSSSVVTVRRRQERLEYSLDPVSRDTTSVTHVVNLTNKREWSGSLFWFHDQVFDRGDTRPERSVMEASARVRQGFGRWLERRTPVTAFGMELVGTWQRVWARPSGIEQMLTSATLALTGAY